jgi:hypothetical protein
VIEAGKTFTAALSNSKIFDTFVTEHDSRPRDDSRAVPARRSRQAFFGISIRL